MSQNNADVGEQPEPTPDPAPDSFPGGPADAFDPDTESAPPIVADQPRSAQVDEDAVPDEIEEPEELDEEEKDVGPETEDPA